MSQDNDPGLFALVMLLRLHGIAAEKPQLRHRLGSAAIGTVEMLRGGALARKSGAGERNKHGGNGRSKARPEGFHPPPPQALKPQAHLLQKILQAEIGLNFL